MTRIGEEETRRRGAGERRPTRTHPDYGKAEDAALRIYHAISNGGLGSLGAASIPIVWVAELRPDPQETLFEPRDRLVARYCFKWAVGRRLVHLLYPWELVEAATKGKMSDLNDLALTLAAPGEVLRARIRYERWRKR